MALGTLREHALECLSELDQHEQRNDMYEVAEMLFSLKQNETRDTEDQASSSSSSGPGPVQFPVAKTYVQHTTRSYVWRGPKRLATSVSVSIVGSAHDGDCGGATGQRSSESDTPGSQPCRGGERADRDKEWAALTTWLRMNLHQPRTSKREVLFLGKHTEGRGWHFFLNPALGWDDVSSETKMRLRTLPHETELAFSRKYPAKPTRDWVKKTQKYRPPGASVTYAVPLPDMVYSLTAIYYRFEGRPGTGRGRVSPQGLSPTLPTLQPVEGNLAARSGPAGLKVES